MPNLPSFSKTHAPPAIGTRPFDYLAWSAVLLAIAVFNGYAINQLLDGNAALTSRENGFLENAQLLVLVPALAFSWFAGLNGRGAVRVAGVLLALVGSIAFVREIDLKSLTDGSAVVDWLLAYRVQDIVLGLLGAAALLYLFLQRRYFRGLVRLALRWQAWPCVGSFILFAAAKFYFDALPGSYGHFWEELVEANGYFLFALATWRHSSLIGNREFDAPVSRAPASIASHASRAFTTISAMLKRNSALQPIFVSYHAVFEGVFA